jgi:hypothetical protein
MSGYRCEVEVSAGPGRGSLVGRGGHLLVRVRLFDGPDGCAEPLPDAYCDLWPADARELAFCLLAVAEDAEQRSREVGFWRDEWSGWRR